MRLNPSLRRLRTTLFSVFFALTPVLLSATTYTATASGDWSNALTWSGGIAPGANITDADQIIIGIGVTVTMDVDVAIDNPLALMTIFGTLSSNTHKLTLTAGTVAGAGDLILHEIAVGGTGVIAATGNVTVGIFETASTSLVLETNLHIQNELVISGGSFSLLNTASLLLDAGATLELSDGAFLPGSATIQAAGAINLVYSGSSQSTGSETTIGAIANLTVNLTGSDQNLTLNTDLTVATNVNLQQGALVLNGNDLTVNGAMTTAFIGASITGSASSGLVLDGTGNVSLLFSTNGALLDTFVVSQTNGNVSLRSNLTVDSSLQVQQGSLLLNGHNLTVHGALATAAGASLTGGFTSGLTLDGNGNVSLIFAPGSATLLSFVVSQAGGDVTLNADLSVEGNVDLQQGSLILNSYNLTVNGTLATSVGASITGHAASGLALDGTGNASLIFSPNGAILDTLLVSQTNGNATLNSDLTVGGHLDLEKGSLVLNGNTLTVNGAFTTAGSASLTGSASSGLILDGTGNITLVFATNSALLDTLVVSQAGGNVLLNSPLTVGGSIDLQQGALVLNGNELTIKGALATAPGASITGGSTSGLVVDGTSHVSIVFSPNSAILNALTVSQSNATVTINSDLTVGSSVDLQEGSLVLNGYDLTVNGSLQTAAGASMTGNASSGLTLNGTGNVTLGFSQNGAQLDTFTVSQINASVTLQSDLAVGGDIDLQQGALALNGHTLTVNGSFQTAAGASITGSAASDLILYGTGNISLMFSPNGAVLDSLVVGQANGDVTLNSDLTIAGSVDLEQGSLILNGHNLTVNGALTTLIGASITGSATSGLLLDGAGNVTLAFSPGNAMLNTFVVSQSTGMVALQSDLTVVGSADLQQGALLLNGYNLTITGAINTAAGASITGSAASTLVLTGAGDASLIFSPNNAILDTLVVSQSNGNVTLGSDLTVEGSVDLQQGALVLNGNNLIVHGSFSNQAGAAILGSAASGLVLDGTGNVSLIFSQNGALLDTFVVSQTNGNVLLNGDLTVGSNVNLQEGALVLNGHELTVHGSFATSIGASISGNSASGLILDGNGDVSLIFSPGSSILGALAVSQTNGNVVLNSNLTINNNLNLQQGSLALNGNNLTVNGMIMTTPGASITGDAASGLLLLGSGNMSLFFAPNSALLDTLVVSKTVGNVTLNSDLTVGGSINLQQGTLVLNGNNLTSNGTFTTVVGASVTGSAASGLNLYGTGDVSLIFSPNGAVLDTLVVSQSGGNVTLESNLTVAGSVDLQQGALVLNGFNLTVNGALATAAGASITGGSTSGLILDGGTDVSLIFSPNSAVLDTLVVSQTNGNVTMNSDLSVAGLADLQQGSLVLNGNDLTITGALTTLPGASITGGITSDLTLDGDGNVSLIFSPNGTALDTLVVSQTNGNVTLTSDLTIGGSVDLQQGSLVLNGGNLTVNGALQTAVGASITGSATGGLILDGTGNVSLIFSPNGATLDTFVVSQTNGDVTLNSDLAVVGSVDVQQGALILNGYDLTVNGALSTAAGASITGDAAAGLILDGTTDVSLVFSPGSATLNTFIVSQSGGDVTLNSDLTVLGTLNLQEGSLVLNGNDLTINGTLDTWAGASLTGSATSGLTLDGAGDASLIFSPAGATLSNLVVSQSNGNVTLLSDLTVGGSVDLQQGSLELNHGNLTITGILLTTPGATFTGSSSGGLILDGTGDVSLVFAPNGALLGTLVVSQTNGNVALNSNLTVGSNLDLQEGSLILNGNILAVNGVLNTSAGASITGSASSGLIIDGTGDVSIVFAPGAALLSTFVVSQSNGNVILNGDLQVLGFTNLQQGSLVLNSNNLTSNGFLTTAVGASITGDADADLTLLGSGNVSLIFAPNGATLDSLVIWKTNGNVTLNSDLTVNGDCSLVQGSLVLNGNDLTIHGTMSTSASASITGSNTSGLILDGTGDVWLIFAANSSKLDTLVVSQTNGNVNLNADLTVSGSVDLQQGSLVLNGNDLTVNGLLTTASGASITGNAASTLTLDGTGITTVAFAPNSAVLHTLVASQMFGRVALRSDLTVVANATVEQGYLALNGNNLTITGTLAIAPGASIAGSVSSGLILDGTGNVSLVFLPGQDMLDTFIVSQTNGNVTLNSDLQVVGSIVLQQGSLLLNGNDLTVNGAIATMAGASITGAATSGLILDGIGNALLIFAPNSSLLDTLVVSQANGSVVLNSSLTVGGSVDLQEGSLVLNGNTLTVNGAWSTSAGATITGGPSSSLLLNGHGDVSLVFAPNTAQLHTLVVNQSNGHVTLQSDLKVVNSVDIQQGALVLNGNDLTINGSLATTAGASITGSAASGLILDGTGNVSLIFSPNSAVLNSLVVSQTNGDVHLNSGLTIEGNLDLQQGNLVLGGNNVTLSDNAHITGGSAGSYVVTNGSGALSALVKAGASGVLFPCGSSDGYFPASILQANGASDAHISVNVGQGVLANGTTGTNLAATESLVDHTWFIASTDANAQLDLNFKFSWNVAAEVNGFSHHACFISHYVNGDWDTQTVAQAAAEANGYFSITRDHITSLSPFRVANATASGTSTVEFGDIQIFPNPALGASPAYLRFDAPSDRALQLRIFDAAGQLVQTESLEVSAGNNVYALPVAGLKPGVYFIEIQEDAMQGVVVRRLVKQD